MLYEVARPAARPVELTGRHLGIKADTFARPFEILVPDFAQETCCA